LVKETFGQQLKEQVKAIIEESYHGDDVYNQLKIPELANKVNLIKFAEFAARRGLTCTPAMKGDKMAAFLSVDTATYLKRTFRVIDGIWRVLRPIPEILEVFNWWEMGEKPWPEHLKAIIDASLTELHHYGPDVYEEYRVKFAKLFTEQTGSILPMDDYVTKAEKMGLYML